MSVCCPSFGGNPARVQLHSVWDDCLVEELAHGRDAAGDEQRGGEDVHAVEIDAGRDLRVRADLLLLGFLAADVEAFKTLQHRLLLFGAENVFFAGAVIDRGDEQAGVGLAVTKHLIRAMGGEIFVSSAENQGSEFEIDLPLVPSMPASGLD